MGGATFDGQNSARPIWSHISRGTTTACQSVFGYLDPLGFHPFETLNPKQIPVAHEGLSFRAPGISSVESLGFRISGSRFRVEGLGSRI